VRGDAGENAKEGKSCPVCGCSVPPSLGVKPRTYCSRHCLRIASGRTPKPAVVPCVSCGRDVQQNLRSSGRPRRHCSDECRRASKTKKPVHARLCGRCGKIFVRFRNSQFCSDDCRYRHRLTTRSCEKCGKLFKQRQHTSRFCSNSCSTSVTAKTRSRQPVNRQCLCCQKPFRKRSSGRNAGKYCSRECAFEARRLRLPCARLTNRPGATLDEQIAVWFSSWGNDASETLNVGINSGGHKRRCMKYGCHYESFQAKSILHRDNWTCRICQCELLPKWTKIDGSETPHPRSPTIDHIVPLSYGPSGPGHRPDNVQAACWACNIKKSDSFAGPLPTVQYS
jgi:hypothetical protein